MTLTEDRIRGIVGLSKGRQKCWVQCEKKRQRLPCDCEPGYSMATAIEIIRRTEAHYDLTPKEKS